MSIYEIINNVKKIFLNSGQQTKVTDTIQKLANKFLSKDFELMLLLLEWIQQNISVKTEEQNQLFRNRTAEQILSDHFSTGCTDTTLLFLALCRAKGYPAKYVELLDRQWLESPKEEVVGHVIAEVEIKGKWYFVDPTYGSISLKKPSGTIVYDKGLDSWDIGVTHENWQEKFYQFRDKYKKEVVSKRASH
jgi:transglutaminase-like putative cysteine protease